ncbi:MAG: flavodoxin family protein [Proteobacteria bacterium]|nr:flavodoxin family protein [Pseudomonadota bacterium]
MKVRILGIAGSPRKGNTENAVKLALESAKEVYEGIETFFISLAEKRVYPCEGCYQCYGFNKGATWENVCYIHRDDVGEIYKEISLADGVIIGSPSYAFDVSAKLKALFERGAPFCHYAGSSLSGAISHKVVGGIVVAFERRGGQESALSTIHKWALSIGSSFIVGARPHKSDPPPQSSFLGGLVDTCDSIMPLGENAFHTDSSRTRPPISGLMNIRSIRNLGKTVAESAIIIKAGIEELKKKGLILDPLPIVNFPKASVKENSYFDRVKRGLETPPEYQIFPGIEKKE